MKFLIAFLVTVLIAVGVGFGMYFFLQSQPAAPVSSSSVPQASIKEQKGPKEIHKIPAALEKAIKANSDTVAWINIPNTDINNSVVQTIDNSYYLRRNESKQDEIYGCYYFDYECSVGAREVLAPNTIIYGHSSPKDNPDGKRFSQLFRFVNPEFAEANPIITITTTEETLSFEIFAVFYTLTDFDYIQVQISDEEMREITKKAEALSLFDYAAEITPQDKILTLSTCSELLSPNGDGRLVIMARLLPYGAQLPQRAQFTVK